MSFPHHLRRNRSILTAGISYLLLALVCTQFPLLNYLGFESSLVVALFSSAAGCLLGISTMQQRMAEGDSPLAVFLGALAAHLVLLLIPLLVFLLNALFVRNCSLFEGIAFYLLLPVVSVWFAHCLAFFCIQHYRRPRLVFLAFFAATMLYAVMIGYFTPGVFSYNVFYGYFPGFTYDEFLEISWTLVLFRLLTVLGGAVLLWLGWLIATQADRHALSLRKGLLLMKMLAEPGRRVVTFGILLGLILLYLFRCNLGFETTAGCIQSRLGSRYELNGGIIYYDAAVYDTADIRWVAAEHGFLCEEISGMLQLEATPSVESYIYPTSAAKQKMIGAGVTNIAKPWSGQIHVSATALPEVLKHELVHVLAAPLGVPVLRANLSPGLTEGLAMAIEWDWGNRTLHEYSAMMKQAGLLPDIDDILSPAGFLRRSSSVSYVVAGSFLRFIMDRYGFAAAKSLYRSGSVGEACGVPHQDVVRSWHTMIDSIHTEAPEDIIDLYFRRPPIFGKVCARVVARRNAEAQRALAARRYDEAADLFRHSFDESGSSEALAGYAASLVRGGRTKEAVAVLDSIVLKQEFPGRFLPLFPLLGDVLWKERDTARAKALYRRVVRADYAENVTESARLRLLVIGDSLAGPHVLRYLLSDAADSVRATRIDSAFVIQPQADAVRFLRARSLIRAEQWEEALDMLRTCSFAATDQRLEFSRRKAIGHCLFRLRRFRESRVIFLQLLDEKLPRAMSDDLHAWVDRCEWYEKNFDQMAQR